MIITPETIARLIFATTQLRFFEKEYLIEPSVDLNDIVVKWQHKVDEILNSMGMQEFMPYDKLVELLKITQ